MAGSLRSFVGWFGIVVPLGIVAALITVGLKPGEKLGAGKTTILTYCVKFASRAILFGVNVLYVGTRTNESSVDYRKYLGPDWKLDPELKAGIQVANHTCFIDVLLMGYL